jgi:hypothetical protein
MAKLVKLNDKGFNNMIGKLRQQVKVTAKEATDSYARDVLQNAARETGKANYKKIVEDVDRSLSRIFTSSNKTKVRKAKDGSLVVKSATISNNKWIKIRNKYSLNNTSNKGPNNKTFSKKQTSAINKALSEMRKKRKSMLTKKKKNIASGQATFIYMLRKLRIPLLKAKGLAAALKVKLPLSHMRAIGAKATNMGEGNYTIILKSKSIAALNPNAKGLDSFRKAFNSQVKGFEIAARKSLKSTAKKFAKRNGFIVR